MKVLLIDNGTVLLEKLKSLIPGVEVVKKWKDIDIKDAENFDIIVLSGGNVKSLVGNEAEYEKELELVKNTNKPLIGICFGSEVVALAFGSTLKELDEKQKGRKIIEILDEDMGKRDIEVYECHKWAINSVSEDLIVLGRSSTGPEIIKHKNRPIYGFQFHPENMVNETDGDELFLNLLEQFK